MCAKSILISIILIATNRNVYTLARRTWAADYTASLQVDRPEMQDTISSIFDLNMHVPSTTTQSSAISMPTTTQSVAKSRPELQDPNSSIFNLNMGKPTLPTSPISFPKVAQNLNTNSIGIRRPELQGPISSIFNLNMGTPTPPILSTRRFMESAQDPNTNSMGTSWSELPGRISSVFNLNIGTSTVRTVSSKRDREALLKMQDSYMVTPTTKQPLPINITQAGNERSCGFGKRCTPHYLCSNGTINEYGISLIDMRLQDEATCPLLETCCTDDELINEPNVRPEFAPTVCGRRNAEGVAFQIIGARDNEAQFGEFPWMVAILRETIGTTTTFLSYHRGGSLITPKIVLTAAHCVRDSLANTFTVRAGEWDSSSFNEPYQHQDRKVVEITIHEHFNGRNLRNDIALMFLATPFDLAPNVNTICLPPAGYNFDFKRCYVTGWGKDKFQGGRYVNILKKIDLSVVPHSRCQANLRNTRLGKRFNLHLSFLCAGGEPGKDTCTGDGGSPLVCPIRNHPNSFYQAGIVSWGIGCGEESVPGVYASVSELRGWIDIKLAKKGISSSEFTFK